MDCDDLFSDLFGTKWNYIYIVPLRTRFCGPQNRVFLKLLILRSWRSYESSFFLSSLFFLFFFSLLFFLFFLCLIFSSSFISHFFSQTSLFLSYFFLSPLFSLSSFFLSVYPCQVSKEKGLLTRPAIASLNETFQYKLDIGSHLAIHFKIQNPSKYTGKKD